MSEYHDYIVDFPGRCLNILDFFESESRIKEREVTLLLMATTSALIVPMERLQRTHPTENYRALRDGITTYDRELGKKWVNSALSKDITGWIHGFVKEYGDGPEGWPEPTEKVDEKQVGEILFIIRNALSHGNIYTKGNPIATLIFYSAKRKLNSNCNYDILGWNHIFISVIGLNKFLKNWFDLLNSISPNFRTALEILSMNTEDYNSSD